MRSHILIRVVFTVVLAAAVGFAWGFLTDEIRLPPYRTLRHVVDWGRNQPKIRTVHDFLRRRHTDVAGRTGGAWLPISERDLQRSGADGATRRERLRSVGYLSGYEPSPGMSGVTVYVPELACPGLNLITSGHAPEAELVDMEGRILHRWSYDFGDAFPDYRDVDGRFLLKPFYPYYWRRAFLCPNGDLLAIFDGMGLIRLDKDSKLLWKVQEGCHHDCFLVGDSLIYTLGRELTSLPELDPDGQLLEDFLIILDADGRVLKKISLIEAFENSVYAPLLTHRQPFPDVLHTNTIQVLTGRHADRSEVFERGNVLISARNIDVVAILNPREEKIVWALCGLWKGQHEPTLLANGNLLVFDNQGSDGMSRVLEIDPLTQDVVWEYEGTPENGFYSKACSAAHRLPNGNTLIIESEAGRAFEVTPSKRIVWEYYNPQRAGEGETLIATLFDVARLPADFPLDSLETSPLASSHAGVH